MDQTALNDGVSKKHGATITVLASVLITAIVTSGSVYAYHEHELNKVRDNLQVQIDNLKTELAAAKIPSSTSGKVGWKSYANKQYGFSFKYPQDWSLKQSGPVTPTSRELVSLKSPEAIAENLPVYGDNFTISYSKTINDELASGGDWMGKRTYADLADFLTDTSSTIGKIGETTVGDKKGFEVIVGGYGSSYAIMVENDGIYTLNFIKAADRGSLSSVEKEILSTFVFNK